MAGGVVAVLEVADAATVLAREAVLAKMEVPVGTDLASAVRTVPMVKALPVASSLSPAL